MKNVLRFLAILLVAVLVAGGTYMLVENTNLPAGGAQAHGENSFGNDNGQGRPNGERQVVENGGNVTRPLSGMEGAGGQRTASFPRGLDDLLTSLAKITGITVAVVLIQTLVSRPRKNPKTAAAAG